MFKRKSLSFLLFFFTIINVQEVYVFAEQNIETKVGIELVEQNSSTTSTQSSSSKPKAKQANINKQGLPRTGSSQEGLMQIAGFTIIGITTAMSYLYHQKMEKREKHD